MKGDEEPESHENNDTLTIFTMLVRCPRGGTPNSTCPFALFRDRYTLEEKFQLAKSLPEGTRREMMDFHQHCLATAYAKEVHRA